MSWFTYHCPDHGDFKVALDKRSKTYQCVQCGVEAKPVLKAGTSRTVEVLDNGAMARSVERLHNIEDIMAERNAKHSIKQDGGDET